MTMTWMNQRQHKRSFDLIDLLQAKRFNMAPTVIVGGLLWLAALALPAVRAADAGKCRCFPGDACWPSSADWSAFNATIDGTLIATVPLAQPCHDPEYNAETCDNLRNNWLKPEQQCVFHRCLDLVDFPDTA